MHRPTATFKYFQKYAFYAGIKNFNSLALRLASLTNEKAPFNVALTHSSYSVEFFLFKNIPQYSTQNLYNTGIVKISISHCRFGKFSDLWNVFTYICVCARAHTHTNTRISSALTETRGSTLKSKA
jgi:hypothetical protein